MRLVHSVQPESRPPSTNRHQGGAPQFLFDRPAKDLPTHPFKNFPLGRPLREASAEPRVRRQWDFSRWAAGW